MDILFLSNVEEKNEQQMEKSPLLFQTMSLQRHWIGAEEELSYHKKAAAFIETCYWRAKITLSNNNPPPWKPIKR